MKEIETKIAKIQGEIAYSNAAQKPEDCPVYDDEDNSTGSVGSIVGSLVGVICFCCIIGFIFWFCCGRGQVYWGDHHEEVVTTTVVTKHYDQNGVEMSDGGYQEEE